MMKKAVTILFAGLLLLALAAISWADGDNTSTVFKGSGDSRHYYYDSYNSYGGFEALEALDALESLDALDELDDLDDELMYLDLEMDDLEAELNELKHYRKYKYKYNDDHDYACNFDFDDDDHDYGHGHSYHFGYGHNFRRCNNLDIDFEDGDVFITHSGRRSGSVRITEDYELYVNSKHVITNDDQKKLLVEFYSSVEKLNKYAASIGAKGVEIGIDGAKIGLSAISGIFKLILPNYDTDDLEREMDRKSKRIEYKASLLEKEAKALEHLAYDIEDIADELKHEIPELNKLRWF